MLKIIRRTIVAIALLWSTSLFAQNDVNLGQQVEIITQYGSMTVLLYDKTPQHRDNFMKLVKEGFYNDLLFHRVINGFMIQGGDPKSKDAAEGAPLGQGGPGYTIPAEFIPGYYHKKGALAAARQGDQVNPEKRSSGSQFYIVDGKPYEKVDLDRLSQRKEMMYYRSKINACLADSAFEEDLIKFKALRAAQDNEGLTAFNEEMKAKIDQMEGGPPSYSYTEDQIGNYATLGGAPHLDGDYTVFGEVLSGFEVIDIIAEVTTDGKARPLEDIRMTIRVID